MSRPSPAGGGGLLLLEDVPDIAGRLLPLFGLLSLAGDPHLGHALREEGMQRIEHSIQEV